MDLHQVSMLQTLERVVAFLSAEKGGSTASEPVKEFRRDMQNFVRYVYSTVSNATSGNYEAIRTKHQDSFNRLKTQSETLTLTLTAEYMDVVRRECGKFREALSELLTLFLRLSPSQ